MPNGIKNRKLNIAIIGAGNIGAKRVQAILDLKTDRVVAVYDINFKKAQALANAAHAAAVRDLGAIFNNSKVDAVVIAATTDVNLGLALKVLAAKKNVLVEKPLGSLSKDALAVSKAAQKSGKILKVGFNHRHHPAVAKAFELYKAGKIGKAMYIRSVYGHGARPGYDLEWRMQKKYSPGGELFDQGVHIIDLAFWFLGKFKSAFAVNKNVYWHKSRLEDNSFALLESAGGANVFFHASLTQWKNRFNFEIYGNKGYLIINGLGKSYGVETLTLGTDVGQGRAPLEEIFEFVGEDVSWKEEWKEFRQAIILKRQPLASAQDNVEVVLALEALYCSAKSNKLEKIKKLMV